MKSNTLLCILLPTFFLSVHGFSDEQKLPPAAEELRAKLNSWEAEKEAALKKEILEQRKKVAAALGRHLDQATKSGDLDGAVAIRKYIDQLNSTTAAASQATSVATALPDPFSTKGEVWRGDHPDKKGVEIEFVVGRNGQIEYKENGNSKQFSEKTITKKGDHLFHINHANGNQYWVIEVDKNNRNSAVFRFRDHATASQATIKLEQR